MKKKLTAFLFALCFAVIGLFACAPVDETSKYSVTLDYTASQGTVTLDPVRDSYEAGEQITVTVTPNEGYTVETFTVNGENAALTDSVYRFEIEKDTVVKVVFKSTQTAADTFEVSTEYDAQRGSITLEPASEDGKYEAGTSVTATVTALEGFELETFTVNGQSAELTENRYTFEVNADTALKATFKEVGAEVTYYNVSASCDETKGSVSIEPAPADGKIAAGTSVTVTVTPDEHYEIGSFTVNGQPAEISDGKYVFTVNGDAEIAVTFIGKAYEITLEYDGELGSVALSGGEGGVYRYGDEITVTVTPAQTAAISSVTINGAEAQLEQNACSFTLEGETTIAVQFYSTAFTQEMLDSLKGKILFDGSYLYQYTDLADDAFDYNETMIVKTMFEEGMVWIREYWDGETQYDYVLVDHNGKAAQVAHTVQNGIEYYDSEDSIEPYLNPFEWTDITTSSFEYVSEGLYRLTIDASRLKEVAAAITGYNETIEEFYLTVENGAVTGITIKTGEVPVHDPYDRENPIIGTYISDYTFTVTEHGTATIPEEYYKPYAGTEAHAELKSALEAADAATSYTIHRSDYFADDGSTNTYDVYVTESAIYLDHSKNPDDPFDFDDKHGYALLDGDVYPFEYDQAANSFEFDEGLGADALSSLRALFNCFAPELLESKGDGVFELRLVDMLLAGEIATNFGNGRDEKMEYEYATSFKITVKDGKIESIEITEDVWGSVLVVTLTFEKFNETTLPIEIKKDVPPTPVEIPSAWYGTFKGADDSGVAYVVNISAEGIAITIDGTPATVEIVLYDEDGDFTLTVNGAEYYLSNMSYEEPIDSIALVSKDQSVVVSLEREGEVPPTPGVEIPSAWYGTFKGEDEGIAYVVEISAEAIAITINGAPATVQIVSYDDYEGFTLTVNGAEYYLSSMSYEGTIDSIALIAGDYSAWVTLDREGDVPPTPGVEIPEEWYGTFKFANEEGELIITITADGITMQVDEIYPAEILSYNAADRSFRIIVNLQEYTLKCTDSGDTVDHLQLLVDGDLVYALERTGDAPTPGVKIPEAWYGTFKGNDDYGNEVVLKIDENGMTLTINGAPMDLKVLSFDGSYTFEITIDGAEYSLEDSSYGSGVDILLISDDTYSTMIFLNRTEEEGPTPDVEIPAEWFGVYKGTKSEVEYVLTIDGNGMTLTVGGEPREVEVLSYNGRNTFGLSIGGVDYTLENYGDGLLALYPDYRNMVYLTLSEDAPEGGIPEKFYGTFKGSNRAEQDVYVVIDANGVSMKIGDGALTPGSDVSYESSYSEIYFTVGGVEYSIGDASYDDPITTIMVCDINGYTIYDTFTRTTDPIPSDPISIPESWNGRFEGTAGDGTAYVVEIEDGHVTVTIGGAAPIEAEITDYNDIDGYTLNLNGSEYYLRAVGSGETVDVLQIKDDDGQWGWDEIELTRKEKPVTPTFTEDWIGTYTATKPMFGDGHDFVLTIRADGFTLKVDSGDPEEITDYEFNSVNISFTHNGNDVLIYKYTGKNLRIEYGSGSAVTLYKQATVVKYTVTVQQEGGTVTLDPQQADYDENTAITVTVEAPEGMKVKSFKVNGQETALEENVYRFNITQNTTIEIEYEQDAPADVFPQEWIGFYKGSSFLSGSFEMEIRADGFTFKKGSKDAEEITEFHFDGEELTFSYDGMSATVTRYDTGNLKLVYDGTTTLTKQATVNKYTVTVQQEGGTVTLDPQQAQYDENTSITVTVEAPARKQVKSFKVNGTEQDLTQNKYIFNITQTTTIEIEYEDIPLGETFPVTIETEHGLVELITVSPVGNNEYEKGSDVAFYVEPDFGMKVVAVKVNGAAQELTSGRYTFKIEAATVISVEYAEDEESSFECYADFYGKWMGEGSTADSGVSYTVVINEHTITVFANGTYQRVAHATYQQGNVTGQWGTIQFNLNGEPVTIKNSNVKQIRMSDVNNYGTHVSAILNYVEDGEELPDEDDGGKIPVKWRGTYYTQSATRGDITLVLEKDTLSLTVSYDGTYTGEFTYEDNKFTFEWNSRPITISIATSEASGLVKSITLKYGSSETYTLVRHEEGDAEPDPDPDPDPNPDEDWPTDRLPAEWAGSWDGSYAHEDTGETDYYTLVVNADGSVTLNEFECTNITGKTDPSVGMLYTFECDGVTYTLWQSDEHLALMPDGYISAIPLSRP